MPIITNDVYRDVISPSTPTVELGEEVRRGEVIAEAVPRGGGFCLAHHAPVDGEVRDVTVREVELRAG